MANVQRFHTYEAVKKKLNQMKSM